MRGSGAPLYSAPSGRLVVLNPGLIVGEKYRLEAPIGEGGMATIWRAVHVTLDRPVAVKFLQAVGTHAQQMAARFVQEAKICAGIRHRNVVDILDFGVLEDEQPYMVMELLDGQSLADRYVDGPPLTDWDVLEICAMTLSGLAAVHDAGIVHRDVKPENIFLAQDADGTFPKVIDFGVSKGFASGQRITRTGAVVGTPEYMSPEQARGVKDIGPTSDLWAIGIMLYEGFTGQVPFESENPGDILIQVATQPVPSLGDARPDLPDALVELVARATQKDPKQRFPDARTMRDALLGVLQGSRDLRGRPPSSVVQTAYRSSSGSGKLKALSSRPGPPEVRAPEVTGSQAIPLQSEKLEPIPLETEKLRPMPARIKPAGRPGWVVPAGIGLVLAVGVVAFVAFDGVSALRSAGLLPAAETDEHNGAMGDVRPGQIMATELSDTEEPDTAIALPAVPPPPSDGEEAPEAETIDVPSPPDPPQVEEAL